VESVWTQAPYAFRSIDLTKLASRKEKLTRRKKKLTRRKELTFNPLPIPSVALQSRTIAVMLTQSTDTVLMVTPDHFQFNSQTGETNTFQLRIEHENITTEAKSNLQTALSDSGVRLLTMSSTDECTPDAVFPNNWFSVHAAEVKVLLILYPMLNANRQAERQVEKLTETLNSVGIEISEVFDLTHFEAQGKALEGTGSLIFDRQNKVIYASKSPRMHEEVLQVLAAKLGYSTVVFSSTVDGTLVYHTNVMMCVGTHFAIVCLECIEDAADRQSVSDSLTSHGKAVIEISVEQLKHMCGNVLELKSHTDIGATRIAMSDTAFNAFTEAQREKLVMYGQIVHASIDTIEKVGGGSVRCMLAEIYHL